MATFAVILAAAGKSSRNGNQREATTQEEGRAFLSIDPLGVLHQPLSRIKLFYEVNERSFFSRSLWMAWITGDADQTA